jgi:hypothetical protein
MADDNNNLAKNKDQKAELITDFSQVLLKGFTLGDARLIGLNTGHEVVFKDDLESFKQSWIVSGGDPDSPLIEKSFKTIASAWGAYKTNNYDPREVKGDYDFDGNDPSKPYKWFSSEGFGVTAMDATKSFDVHGKSQLIQNPAQNAEENRFYVSKDKKLFDLKGYDENKNNPLKQVYDEKTGTYTWFEAEDGEIVTADIIRHDNIVGGANKLKSGFWSASARGLYQGAVVKTAQGVQGLLSIGYDLYRMAEDSKDGTLYSGMNDYYGKDGYGRMLGSMQNWINARSRVTTEESEGVFSNLNSFAYNFWDGVGQFLPMIATSYGLGATGALMQASKIPMLAGGIGQRTAVALTKVGGSLSVYGLVRNQMLEDGFTPEEAGLTALLFGAMTYASESVFNADISQKFGYRQAQNMIRGMEHKAVGAAMVENAGGVMTKEMAENLSKRSAGRNAGNLASKWKKFRSFIADQEAPGKGATIGARAAYAFRMAGEEATEELIEGVGQNKLIAPFMNDYARGTAKEINAKYEGLKFDPVKEGPNAGNYIMSTKFGEPQLISVAKRKAIDREVYFANKINSGEALLDEGINVDEAFIAGLSSLFTGGLMAGMGQSSIQKKNQNKWALAMSIIDNPSKRVQIEQEAYQIANEGLLGEKTQAKEYAEQFMQDIDLTVQFIRDKGLNSIDVVEAVNGDRSMMYEIFERVQNQIVLEKAIEQLEKGASLKDIYASLGDNNKVIDPTIDDLNQLKLDLELTKAGIKALTTKRVDLVYEDTKGNKVTGRRSQAYADRFFNVESYEIMLEEKANEMAKASFMFSKSSYDKFLGDGTYARKLEERVQKNKEKLLADKSFNLEANFKIRILGSFSAQFDEFKETAHRQGLEATLKSFQDYIISQAVDDIELKDFQASIGNFMDESYEIEENKASRKTSVRETLKKIRSVKDESVAKIISAAEVKAVAERLKSLNQRTGAILQRLAFSDQQIYESASSISSSVQNILTSSIQEMGMDYQEVMGDPELMAQFNPTELADITTGFSEIQESFSTEKLNAKAEKRVSVPQTIKEALGNEKFREYLNKRNAKNESPNRWVKLLGPAMFEDFSANVIGLLNGLAFGRVANRSELTPEQIKQFKLFGKNQAYGNNILDAFENLMNLMNNKDAVIDNKHAVIETIEKIDRALTSLYFYGKMNNEIIQEKYEKKDETKEMSRLLDREVDGNFQDNQSLRLSKKDFEDIKKFTEKAFEVVNAWSQDLRLGQAGREAYRMKIFSGNLALQYDMLKNAFEEGLFTGDLQKLVNQHLNEIDLIVESIQKRHAESFKSNITMTLWDISLLYSNVDDKEASNKIRLDVMRAFSKMADLKEVIGKDKEGVAALKKYAEEALASAYYPYGHLDTYRGVDVYGMDSANYESYFSPKTYITGKSIYESNSRPKNDINYDFFIRETVNFFYGIERQAGLSSDKKILEAYKTRLESQDKISNVETYEQLMMLLHVIPFIQSGGESFAQIEPEKKNSMKVKSNQVLPGFLSALGYAGAGKTELMVNLVTEVYSSLSGKPIKILIITPTPHLREKHKEAIGTIRGNITAEYMYQHEITNNNKKTRPNFAEYDIVFVEETGMLADNTDLNAYREINKSTKETSKGLAPIIGIGDLGQTPSFGATTTIKTPVGLNTEETKPLTEVHRSGVVSIIALQQFFRKMSFGKTTWAELPTAKWKRIGHRNVGLRYVKENSDKATRDLIKQNFLDAIDRFEKAENRAPKSSEIILVVDTYKDKELLLEDERFKNRASNIFVLEYNSTEIAKNGEYLNWNVSGIGANQVYVAITPNYEDPFMNSAPFVYALFGKLLTAASRGKEYVEIAIREGDVNTEPVEENEDISGYNENLDESKLREERERQNEIYRAERVEELEVILGKTKVEQTPAEKKTEPSVKKEKDSDDNSGNKVFLLERNTPLYEGSVSFNAFDVVKHKKEKDYENTVTHVSDKYNAESKVPLTRALYKLQSKAIRFALETEEGVLYAKMENEFNEAFEELKSSYPKLAKFTAEEVTAYKATVLRDAKLKADFIRNSAPGIIPNMAFTLGDYGGRVLGIEIVGYYEENKGGVTRTVPIVNIHGLSLKSDMKVGFFDKQGITANRYGAYALMIENEGMKVNGIILHRAVPGGSGVLNAGIKSEFFNPVEIAKGIENAKNDILNGQDVNPIASIEELYSEPRLISAPEGMPETGINILYNGDRGVVEAYTATIRGGEVVYTAMVRSAVTNEIKEVDANDLKSSLIKLKLTRSQKGETISEWRNGNVYSNMAFVHPGAVTLLPSVGENFWDWKNNKWMRLKDAIAKIAFEKKGSMTFMKEFHSSVEVMQIGKDGKVMATTETYSDVLLNVIQDTDILQIIKDAELASMGINTVQKFKDAGLHILSFDSAPEVLLTLDQVKDPAIMKGDTFESIAIQDVLPEVYEKYMSGKITDQELSKALSDHYKGVMQEDAHPDQLEMNVYRMNVLKNAKDSGKTSIGLVRLTTQNSLPFKRVTKAGGYEFSDFIANATLSGYTIELNQMITHIDPDTKRATIQVRVMKDGKIVGFIPLQAKKVTKENVSLYKSSLNEEIEGLAQNAEWKVQIDALNKAIEENNNDAAKEARTILYTMLDSLDAIAFINHNRRFFKDRTGSTNGVYFNAEDRLRYTHSDFGLKLRSLSSALGYMISLAEGEQYDLYYPIYKFAESGKKVLIVDNVLTDTDTIFQRRNYFSKIEDGAVKEASSADITLSDQSSNSRGRNNRRMRAFSLNSPESNMNKEEVIEEVARLIGEAAHSNVFFSHGYFTANGVQNYAYVEDGFLHFGNEGRVSLETVKHESMHFIIDYILSPKAAQNLIQKAKEEKARKTGKAVVSISDNEAHEYLADTFQITRPATTLIGKFIQFVKSVIFKIAPRAASINYLFAAANQGVFSSTVKYNSEANIDGAKYRAVENEYNTFEAVMKVSKAFGSLTEMERVRDTLMMSSILGMSMYGKTIDAVMESPIPDTAVTMSQAILNFHKMLVSVDGPQFREVINDYRIADRQFTMLKLSANGDIITGEKKSVSEITPEEYLAMVDIYQNYDRSSDEYFQAYQAIQYYALNKMKDPFIYRVMIQSRYPAANIAELSDEYELSEINTGALHSDNEDRFPDNTRKQVLKALLGNLHVYNYAKTKAYRVPHPSQRFIEIEKLDRILFRAAAAAKAKGYKSFESLVSEMESMLENATSGEYADLIYTFLVHFGDVTNNAQLAPKTNGGKFSLYEHSVLPLFEIEDAGYMYLANKGNWNQIAEAGYDETEKKAILATLAKKREGYMAVMAAMRTFYFSYTDKHLMSHEKGKGEFNYKTYTNQNFAYIHSDTREGINKTHFSQDLSVNLYTKNAFIGDNKYISIGGTGFRMFVNDQDLKIVNKNGNTFAFADEITAKELEDVFRFIFGRKISRPVINNILKNNVANNVQFNVAEQLYYMMNSLYLSSTEMSARETLPAGMNLDMSADKMFIAQKKLQESFYSKSSYTATLGDNEDNKEIEDSYYSPADQWDFIHDSVAYNQAYESMNEGIKTIRNVDGTTRSTYVQSDTLSDSFPMMTFNEDTSIRFANQVKSDIELMGQDNPLKNDIGFTNAILNGDINFSSLKEFIGISDKYKSSKGKEMTTNDIMYELFIMTKRNLISRGMFRAPVMLEILGDRSQLLFTEWHTGTGKGAQFMTANVKTVGKQKTISSVTINKKHLTGIVAQLIAYAENQRLITAKKWNAIAGNETAVIKINSKEAKLIEKSLEKNLEYMAVGGNYVIGNGYTQKTNPYNKMTSSKWNSIEELKKELEGVVEVSGTKIEDYQMAWIEKTFKDDLSELMLFAKSSGIISNTEDEMSKKFDLSTKKRADLATRIEDLFNGLNSYLNDDRTTLTSEAKQVLTEALLSLKSTYTNIRNGEELTYGKNIEIINDLMAKVDMLKVYDKSLSKSVNDQEQWDKWRALKSQVFKVDEILEASKTASRTANEEILKGIFYSHHIFNSSFNQLVRGTEEFYKNVPDFFKRGAGITSPGSGFATSIIGPTSNYIEVADPKMKNKLFSEKTEEATDGVSLLNPLTHAKRRLAAGAELGNVSYGAQKNGYFKFDAGKNTWTYLKFSEMPINGSKLKDPFYMSVLKMMLSKKPYNGVQSIWNKFSLEIETVAKNNGKGFDELVKQMNNYADENGIPIVDGMMFSSTVKFGSRKTQQLSGNLENGLRVDSKINADENIIKIDNDYLRLQTVVAANTFDTKRTISTQLLYIIGVGAHNKPITDKINSAFAEAINDRIELFEIMSNNPDKARFWIRRNAYKYFGNDGNSQKLMRIIFDDSIDTDTWSKKVFDTVIKQINESLRPSMPGINTVQMPAIERVVEDKDGNARVLAYGENEEGSRMLRPISYGKKNDKGKVTYFTDRESLDKALEEDKSSVVFVPGEVIMPFVYKNKFGISKWTTMNDLMTVMGKNMKTKQTANHKPYKILRETFADMFKNVKTEEDIAKALYKDVYNHLLETNKTESLIQDKDKFLNSLAYYYYWLNRSMDIYHVRIPTSNAALGGYSRIIEFSWDYENTIFLSPEKNILDDSDYDIDELHTYTRPIALDEKEKQSAVYKMQTSVFDGIVSYYSNINNADYILQKIDPSSLIKHADESSDSGYVNSTLNNTLKRKKSSNDGKETVGHFVTLQNVISRLFLLGTNKKNGLSQRNSIVFAMPLFDQEDERETSLRTLDLLSNLITGSTDNLKLEGLLGKLNISKETSPLVAGMIVSGVSEAEIFKTLKDSFVNTLANKLYQKNSISSFGKVTLAGLIHDKIGSAKRELTLLMKNEEENKDLIASKENEISSYETLLSYANKGEALRRISELTNIQGGYKAKPYFLYQKLASIEQIFGTSIDNVIAGVHPSIQDQIAFNEKKYAPYSAIDKANEAAIRSYINYNELLNAFPQLLSFIALTKSAVTAIRSSSTVYDQLFNAAEIMGKETSTGTIRNENDFDLILGEIEKMNLADFLSSRGKVKMRFGERYYRDVDGKTRRESAFAEEEDREYDFALPGDRERFFSDFNHYALFMQDKYPKNFFLGRLESRTRYDNRTGRNDLSFVEFANSGSINAEKASEYAESFNSLDEHDKKLFRLYQAITFGFNARNGSFTDVIDTQLEKDYSEWKKENKAKRLYGYEDSQFKDEIYARIPSILSSSRKRQYRSKIIGNNTYAIKESEKKIITNPYTPYINTYNGKTTIFNVPFGYKVDERTNKELSEKNRVTIKTNFAHKVKGNYRFPFMSNGYEITEAKFRQDNPEVILPGDVVVLSTGELAEMNYISPREFEIVTRRKTKTRKSIMWRTQSKAYSEDILNFIIQKLKKSFPNIQIELVDNMTAATSGIGYVRGGVVFLNTDQLQLDTPIHEFTHMFVDILRMTNPMAYNKLYKLGESLLRSNDSSVRSIISAYKNLSREDLIEEIIANITGWNSEQKVIDAYFRAGDENYNTKGKSLWGKIKSAVKLLADLARNTMFSMFNVSEDLKFEFNTLQEFADKFTDLVIAGGVISTVSSTELAMLEKAATVRESKVYRNTTVGQLIGMFSEAGNEKRTIEHSTLLEMLNLKEQIRSMGYKLPQSFIGREIEFTEDDLQNNSSLFTKAFEEYRNQEKNLPNNIRLFLNDVPTKENAAKVFGVKQNGDSRVSYNTLKSVQRAMNYIPGRKYYTVAEFSKEVGIEIDDAFVSEDFIVSVENKATAKDGSTEILISVYDVTNQNLNGTETHERSRNILEGFMSAFKARRNEVEVKNTRLNLKRISMAMFINYIQASNPNIKVNYAGISRVVDGDVQFAPVDMATMNQLLRTIGKIDAVMETIPDNGEAISLRKLLTGENIVSNTIDWNNILASFYTHHKGLGTDYFQTKAETLGDMSRNDQIDFLLKRLQRLIGIKNAAQDGLSRENDEEIKLIINAINSLKNPSILNNQVNRYEEIDNFEKYFFDTNSIGEEHFIMLKSAYHDAEFDVIEKMMQVKKELNPIWEYFTESVKGYVGNPGKERYQKLFDTITVKDMNGNDVEMRTGAIYWTDKIQPGMTQEEIELTERAQKRGLTQDELNMGKKIVDTVTQFYEDLIYHNAIKRNTIDGYIDSEGSLYSRDKAKEDLAKSRYYRGFVPMMKALNDEVASNSTFGNAAKKFAKEQADVHVLYQDGSSLKDQDNEEKYISSLTDRFFSQIGLRVNNGKYGSTNRMHGLLGLASDVDEKGNMIMRATDPSANENTSYDLQTIINYFALSTIRNIAYENNVLPIANALKIKLENDRKAQGGNMQDNVIDMIDDFVRMAIQGQIKHQQFNALVNVEKTMNVVGSIVKPAVMMFNPNVAVLSHFSNMFFIGTEAFANSISGDSGIKMKSLIKARTLFATDWHKVTQLAVQYHLIDATEYHQLHHRHRQIGERNVVSSFMANYTNWMTDYYARAVVMTAKLVEDGVWDALEYDSASGEVKYNYKKDGQFFDETGKFKSKAAEVLFNNLKTQLSYEGHDINEAPVRPYDKRSLRNLKHIADRSVGAFDSSTKALMGSHGLFKNASVFNGWMATKLSMAFGGKNKFSDEGGEWIAIEENGKLVPKWQREFVEGSYRTLVSLISRTIGTGKLQLSTLSPKERRNLGRLGAQLGLFVFIMALFNIDWEDASEMLFGDKKYGTAAEKLKKVKLINSIKYAAESLTIVGPAYSWAKEPFAMLNILSSSFTNAYGEPSFKLITNIIPLSRLYRTVDNIVEETTDEKIVKHIENLNK